MKTNKGKVKVGHTINFERLTEAEIKEANKIQNDKRQNMVQAITAYWRAVITVRQGIKFQERFEKAIEDGVEIKDNYGLPQSKEELVLEARKNYIDLRLLKSKIEDMKEDIRNKWHLDEDAIDAHAKIWLEGKELPV